MPFLEWTDALALGDATIDRQHQGLVAIINEMHRHLDAPDREEQVMLCLTSMYLYAKEHFWDEEALMARLGYPDREAHAELHREFVQKTHELTDLCLSDAMHYPDLLGFLVRWLRVHIAVEDARIMAFARTGRAD